MSLRLNWAGAPAERPVRRATWAEAAEAAAALAPSERAVLHLLARLPFAPAALLGALLDCRSNADLALRGLHGAGLVDAVRPQLRPGPPFRLWHATDLGLAALGIDGGVEPVALATTLRLRARDLLADALELPRVLGAYELLVALAAAGAASPELLAWERPWHRQVRRREHERPRTVALPAYAALAWRGRARAFFLWPDDGLEPLHRHRLPLVRLTVLRAATTGAFPLLVIAAEDSARRADWCRLLEDVAAEARDAPLAAQVGSARELAAMLTGAVAGARGQPEELAARPRIRRLRARTRPYVAIPRLVGPALTVATEAPPSRRAHLALRLDWVDRAILRLVGANVFCPARLVPLLFDLGWRDVRARLSRLHEAGLLRTVERREVGPTAPRVQLLECTTDGLALAAADLGPTAELAYAIHGLIGGGPDAPVGPRQRWLDLLPHTLGVRSFMAELYRATGRRRAAGGDDRVLAWRSEPACWYRALRPDGHGVVLHDGRPHHFLLEVDRCTERAPLHRGKFRRVWQHADLGVFARLYGATPTLLFVAGGAFGEERLAATGRRVAAELGATPVLLTTTARLRADPDGPLGPVWRDPWRAERRCWPSGRAS